MRAGESDSELHFAVPIFLQLLQVIFACRHMELNFVRLFFGCQTFTLPLQGRFQFPNHLLPRLADVFGGASHFPFPAIEALFLLGFEEAVPLFHGSPEASEMMHVERIALGQVEVEEATPFTGGAGDEFDVVRGV